MVAAGLVYASFCHILFKYIEDIAVMVGIPRVLCHLGIHLVVSIRIFQILKLQVDHITLCERRLVGSRAGLPVIVAQHIRSHVGRFLAVHNGGGHGKQIAADRVAAAVAGKVVKGIQVRVNCGLAACRPCACQDAALQLLIEVVSVCAVLVDGSGDQGIALVAAMPVPDMGIRAEGSADIRRFAAEHALIRFGFGIRKQIAEIACLTISEAVAADRRANEACGIVVSARRRDNVTGEPADLDLSAFIAADNAADRIGAGASYLSALHMGIDDVGILDRANHAADVCGISVDMVSGTGVGIHGRIQDGGVSCITCDTADCGISVTETVRRRNICPHGHFVCGTVLDHASTVAVSRIGAVNVSYQAAYISIGALHISAYHALLDRRVHGLTSQDAGIVSGSSDIVIVSLDP